MIVARILLLVVAISCASWLVSSFNAGTSTRPSSLQKRWNGVISRNGATSSRVSSGRNAIVSSSFLSMSGSGDVEDVNVVVVGSGISGSTAAFYLNKNNEDVVVTEARDYAGGNLISKRKDGFLWEEGPNSFQPNPAILRFAKDLGLIDELVLADPTLPRFVFWEDRLFALPGGLTDLPFFNLLTWPAKIRAGLGALGFIAPKPTDREESVKEFVTRHLGEQVFTRIIDPFVSGVYAGDPSSLSMQAALKKVSNLERLGVNSGILSGAIVRIDQLQAEKEANRERDADLPQIPGGSLGSFKNGLQSLPLAVQEQLGPEKFRVNYKLLNVQKDTEGRWISTFETPSGVKTLRSKSLLLTAPGHVMSKITGGPDGVVPESEELDNINYPPVASVTIAYPDSAFKDGPPIRAGFGHLIPRAMKVRTLGTIWSSSLFPGRAPEGYTMLLNYIGGAQDEGIRDLSDEQIVDQVHQDVSKILLKPGAEKPKVLGVRLWPKAIPQYNKGHLEILDKVQGAADSKKTGIFLGGNYVTGVAFGDCVNYGAEIATTISEFLATETSIEQKQQQSVSST